MKSAPDKRPPDEAHGQEKKLSDRNSDAWGSCDKRVHTDTLLYFCTFGIQLKNFEKLLYFCTGPNSKIQLNFANIFAFLQLYFQMFHERAGG